MLGLFIWAARIALSVDRSRLHQVEDIQTRLTASRTRVDELETEVAKLHDELNEQRLKTGRSTSRAEGLQVELEWRSRQVTRMEGEIVRLREDIARLETAAGKPRLGDPP